MMYKRSWIFTKMIDFYRKNVKHMRLIYDFSLSLNAHQNLTHINSQLNSEKFSIIQFEVNWIFFFQNSIQFNSLWRVRRKKLQNLKKFWTCFRFCDVAHCKIVSTFFEFILISFRSTIRSRYLISWTKNSHLSISICRSASRKRCNIFLTCFMCFFLKLL
jgi:hypothetical protein